ncbi:MAG: hypothetical protein D6805_08350 [Planctomycetota bacterium]|nr:MAG: hypothetical protein D6805_08350 [Planctomycetota bacterium]
MKESPLSLRKKLSRKTTLNELFQSLSQRVLGKFLILQRRSLFCLGRGEKLKKKFFLTFLQRNTIFSIKFKNYSKYCIVSPFAGMGALRNFFSQIKNLFFGKKNTVLGVAFLLLASALLTAMFFSNRHPSKKTLATRGSDLMRKSSLYKPIFKKRENLNSNKNNFYQWLFKRNFLETRQNLQLKMRYTLEKKIETMLEQIPSIEEAIVEIAFPGKEKIALFRKALEKPKAAVCVKLVEGRRYLRPSLVRAIASIVSSSVPQLKPEQVGILSRGRFYSVDRISWIDEKLYWEEHCHKTLQKAFLDLPRLAPYRIKKFHLTLRWADSQKLGRPQGVELSLLMDGMPSTRALGYLKNLVKTTLWPLPLEGFRVHSLSSLSTQSSHSSTFLKFLPLIGVVFFFTLAFWIYREVWPNLKKSSSFGERGKIPKLDHLSSFDSLALLPDEALRKALCEIDKENLCIALMVAPPSLKRKILHNLPPHERAFLEEEMNTVGPVMVGELEAAQQSVLASFQGILHNLTQERRIA